VQLGSDAPADGVLVRLHQPDIDRHPPRPGTRAKGANLELDIVAVQVNGTRDQVISTGVDAQSITRRGRAGPNGHDLARLHHHVPFDNRVRQDDAGVFNYDLQGSVPYAGIVGAAVRRSATSRPPSTSITRSASLATASRS